MPLSQYNFGTSDNKQNNEPYMNKTGNVMQFKVHFITIQS